MDEDPSSASDIERMLTDGSVPSAASYGATAPSSTPFEEMTWARSANQSSRACHDGEEGWGALSLVAAALLFAACSAPDRLTVRPFTPAVDGTDRPDSPAGSMRRHAPVAKGGMVSARTGRRARPRRSPLGQWRAGAAGWWRDGRFEWWSNSVAFGRTIDTLRISWRRSGQCSAARAGTFAASGAVRVATPARRERGWLRVESDEVSLVVGRWVIGTGAPSQGR